MWDEQCVHVYECWTGVCVSMCVVCVCGCVLCADRTVCVDLLHRHIVVINVWPSSIQLTTHKDLNFHSGKSIPGRESIEFSEYFAGHYRGFCLPNAAGCLYLLPVHKYVHYREFTLTCIPHTSTHGDYRYIWAKLCAYVDVYGIAHADTWHVVNTKKPRFIVVIYLTFVFSSMRLYNSNSMPINWWAHMSITYWCLIVC